MYFKKKTTRILAAILSIIILIATFTSCNLNSGNNQQTETQHKHTWKNATCEEPKTCSGCGESEGVPLQHKYVDNNCEYCGMEDPAYSEFVLGASIYSDLLAVAADVESVGNYINKALYFAIYEADKIASSSDTIKEFAEYINADEDFVDEVVTEYLITIGYSQNQINNETKAQALNSIDYAVEIAIWLCEDAGLTNKIEDNLEKTKSSLKLLSNAYDETTGLSELKEMHINVKNYYELVITAECSYNEFNTKIDKYTEDILKNIDNLDFIYD